MSKYHNLIITALNEILDEDDIQAPEWSDETILLESGIDSLGFAVLVSRLEDQLGFDPFTIMEDAVYPRTLGEFVSVYDENGS